MIPLKKLAEVLFGGIKPDSENVVKTIRDGEGENPVGKLAKEMLNVKQEKR